MKLRGKAGILAAAVVMLALLSACTIRYAESKRLGEAGTAVSEVQVLFDATPPEKTQVVTQGNIIGLQAMHDTNVKYLAPREQRRVQELLATGFRERFPGIAARYGLAVSPTAAAKLRLRVVDEMIRDGGSITRILLQGQLIDASGRTVWRFETSAKNRTVFAKFDETVVDRISVELLEALKRDRLIGA